jgi:hypothetical protein
MTIHKRIVLLKNIEKLIAESVYYRSHNGEMNHECKYVVWNYFEDIGKVHLT